MGFLGQSPGHQARAGFPVRTDPRVPNPAHRSSRRGHSVSSRPRTEHHGWHFMSRRSPRIQSYSLCCLRKSSAMKSEP